jgi:hypothetical protein
MAELWYPLDFKFNVLQMTKPLEVTGNLSLPKPTLAAMAEWLEA